MNMLMVTAFTYVREACFVCYLMVCGTFIVCVCSTAVTICSYEMLDIYCHVLWYAAVILIIAVQ